MTIASANVCWEGNSGHRADVVRSAIFGRYELPGLTVQKNAFSARERRYSSLTLHVIEIVRLWHNSRDRHDFK